MTNDAEDANTHIAERLPGGDDSAPSRPRIMASCLEREGRLHGLAPKVSEVFDTSRNRRRFRVALNALKES